MGVPAFSIESVEPDSALSGLTIKQTKALVGLLAGKSTTEAAKAAGVRRSTVSFWSHHHLTFQVQLIAARRELHAQILQSLWAEGLASVNYLASVRDSKYAGTDERMKAAQSLLKAAAWPQSAVVPVGPNSRQIEMLREMSLAEGAEAEDEELLAFARAVEGFDLTSKQAELESQKRIVTELKAQLVATPPQGKPGSGTQLNPTDRAELDARHARAELKVERLQTTISRFEARLEHLCGAFRCIYEREADVNARNSAVPQ